VPGANTANQYNPDFPYDEYYVNISPDVVAPVPVGADLDKSPILLYPRVILTLPELFVKVDNWVLGVPLTLEFLMLAYNEDSILVCVYPGREIILHLGKESNFALVFRVGHGHWEDQKRFQAFPPRDVPRWIFWQFDAYFGQYRNAFPYPEIEDDVFDPDTFELLRASRSAALATFPACSTDRWEKLMLRLHERAFDERCLTIQRDLVWNKDMLDLWSNFVSRMLVPQKWSDLTSRLLHSEYRLRFWHVYDLLQVEQKFIRPLCFNIAYHCAVRGWTVLKDPWEGYKKYARLCRKILKLHRDFCKSVLVMKKSVLLKKTHQLGKYDRMCRNILKLHRDFDKSLLFPEIHQLLTERLARSTNEVKNMKASFTALSLAYQVQQIQLEQLQQQLATAQARKPAPEQPACCVCLGPQPDVLFEPCRHLCVCSTCYEQEPLPLCPTCREPITNHVQTVHAIVCIACKSNLPNTVLLPCGHQVLCNTCVAADSPAQCLVLGCDMAVTGCRVAFL